VRTAELAFACSGGGLSVAELAKRRDGAVARKRRGELEAVVWRRRGELAPAVRKLKAARRRLSELAAAEGWGGGEETEGRARGGGVELAGGARDGEEAAGRARSGDRAQGRERKDEKN